VVMCFCCLTLSLLLQFLQLGLKSDEMKDFVNVTFSASATVLVGD
jgi:hypothetical protein